VRTLSGPSAASSARPRDSSADAIRSCCEPPVDVSFLRNGDRSARNNVYPARRLRSLRADQSGTRAKADGTRPDGVPGSRVPHPPGSRGRDGDPDLALVEGPSDADLCEAAAAPPEWPGADPSGNAAAVRAGLVRRIPP